MLRAIVLAAFVFLLPQLAPAAPRSQACEAAATSWQCTAVIETRFNGMTIRSTVFKNDELLAEIEGHGKVKRLLVAQPSGAELYFGLAADELSQPGKNPFVFFMEGAGVPVAALLNAFPAGPSSVPHRETRVQVRIGQKPGTLAARALATPGRIAFKLESAGMPTLEGEVSLVFPQPLPGTYPIDAWERASGPRLKLLQDARQAR